MCQYSSVNGYANDWHLVHLGSRASYGVGLIVFEATAVEPRGRISPSDLGIWDDDHIPALARVVSFIRQHGSVAGIQLAHAGRKASTSRPWEGHRPLNPGEGGWVRVGPSPIPFSHDYQELEPLSEGEIEVVVEAFVKGARRAVQAGIQFIEIHAAHGYLLHSFLSPVSNTRTDQFGGSFENRTRLLCLVTERVRKAIGEEIILSVRLSCMDWVEKGWNLEDSVQLSAELARLGVDLIDCSSGGTVPHATIPLHEGYQVPFAERIREQARIATAAVGLITRPDFAESIIREHKADLVFLGRELLRDPAWPVRAAIALGDPTRRVASQYHRML